MTAFSRATGMAALAFAMAAAPAFADTVYNTSLQNLSGTTNDGNPATADSASIATTTSATGTVTTVSPKGLVPGDNNNANRAHGTATAGSWYQDNVGVGTTVGITTDYARSGNGSAYFNQDIAQNGKADLQYYFTANPIPLSDLTSYSFDYLRDSSSTTTSWLAPVLRLNILKDGNFAGTLIWEAVYNLGNGPAVTDTWLTGAGNLSTGNFWTNNALLGPTNATAGGTKTLQAWINDNAGSNLSIYGVQAGFGSGWDGTFEGAVDNIDLTFNRAAAFSANFEVAADTAAVPEPSTWAMMLLGFAAIGAAMRRRKDRTGLAFG